MGFNGQQHRDKYDVSLDYFQSEGQSDEAVRVQMTVSMTKDQEFSFLKSSPLRGLHTLTMRHVAATAVW